MRRDLYDLSRSLDSTVDELSNHSQVAKEIGMKLFEKYTVEFMAYIGGGAVFARKIYCFVFFVGMKVLEYSVESFLTNSKY